MDEQPKGSTAEVKCPSCGNDAVYKHGHTSQAKQRYLCLICGRQFTIGNKRATINHRPSCPSCGRAMHMYRRENDFVRFRCSAYPACRTYIKIKGGEI